MNWCGLSLKQMHQKSDSMTQPVLRDAQNSQDSAFSSHLMSSQLPSSQCSDFSQFASQDMFSQNNSGSQAENNSQQGTKRMSMYEKWLSKRSLFRRDPPHSGAADNRTNPQVATGQTLPPDNARHSCCGSSDSSNALTRPLLDSSLKGSERDLLKQVTYAIHDCSTEMKSALCVVKDKLDTVTETTNDQLAQTLTSFLEDVWKHQEKLQQVLQDQDKSKSVVAELEVKLAKKESQIAALEEQLGQARKDRTPRFAKAVRCEMQSPQLLLQHKLEEILEWTKDTKEQQNQHLNEYLQSMEAHCKQHLNKAQSHETEKRILAELRKVPDKLECKQRELHCQLTKDVKSCLLVYKDDFEEMLKGFLRQYCNQLIFGPEESTTLHRNGVLSLLKAQVEAVSGKLGDVINNHFIKNNQQLAQLQGTLTESIQDIKDTLQAQSLDTEAIAFIGQRLESFQSSLKQHLISIQNKHSSEIQELRNQMYQQLKYPTENILETTQRVPALEPGIMKEISPNFVSPDHLSLTTKGNRSLVAPACSHVNASMLKHCRSAKENTTPRGCVGDKNNLGTSLQMYQRNSQICERNRSTFSGSNFQAFPSVSQEHNQKTPRLSAQAAAASDNLQTACCLPFAQCEVSFTLKSGPSPVVADNSGTCQNNFSKNTQPKQNVVRMKVATPKAKKPADRKRDVGKKKKNTSNKYVENVTVMKTQEEMSFPTGTWTRSRYKCLQHIQTVPQSDQPGSQLTGRIHPSGNDQIYSWNGQQQKAMNPCSSKRDTSVYDFQEHETCKPPEIPRNRKRAASDSAENMSLASFINKGSTEKRKDIALEKYSECSSPTISISKMSIVRKVRTPFRRPYQIDAFNRVGFDRERSPAPTLLSDISCQM